MPAVVVGRAANLLCLTTMIHARALHIASSIGLALPMLVGGCAGDPLKSLSGAMSNAMSGDLTTVVSRLRAPGQFKEAIAKRDIRLANEIYSSNQTALDRDEPAAVKEGVALVNESWNDGLSASVAKIKEIKTQPGTAAEFEGSVIASRDLLTKYQAVPLIKADSSRRSTAFNELESVTSPPQITSWLRETFPRYDHANNPLFLDGANSIIAPETRGLIVRENTQILVLAISRSDDNKAIKLIKAYAGDLDDSARKQTEQAYITRFRKDSKPLSFEQLLVISKAAQQAGLAVDPLKLVRIAAEGSNNSVTLDGQSVVDKLSPSELLKAAAAASPGSRPFIVAIDEPVVTQFSEYSEPKMTSVRRQTGTTQVRNAAYTEAQEALASALTELRDVESENQNLQAQARSLAAQGGSAASRFGAVLGAALGSGLVESARDKVRDARGELSRTSQYTNSPVYGEESQPTMKIVNRRLTQTSAYLIDTRRQTFRSASLTTEEISARILQGQDALNVQNDQPQSQNFGAQVNLITTDLGSKLEANAPRPTSMLIGAISASRDEIRRATEQARSQAEEKSSRVRAEMAQMAGQSAGGTARSARASSGGSSNSCPITLAELDARLPKFAEASLQNVRSEAVRTEVVPGIQQWKASGKTLAQLVDETRASARFSDEQIKVAGQCAAAVSTVIDASDENFVRAVNSGSLAQLSNCEGMRNACLCGALIHKINAMTMRALAGAVQCHSKTMGP